MKKSFAALLLLAGMAAFLTAPAFASDEASGGLANKLVNAQELQERRASSKLRVSGTTDDTVYVGHSTAGAAIAPWYIYSGPYLPDQNDPSIAGNQDGYWGWDNFNAGLNDSLMGWWPYRRLYGLTGGLTLADTDRPWWCFDAGNAVNYVLNSRQQNRTFGVNGVWHQDPGGLGATIAGTNPVAPTIPVGGVAWCGLRGHGDLTAVDAVAQGGYGNAFNGETHTFMGESPTGATAENWPGYASQWDQLLYRDIVVPGGASLTITFDYATVMSTSSTSTASTQSGWFDGDPRSMAAGNFISATSAGANRPADSMMVYIGQPVDVNNCSYSDGLTEPVFDIKRRWKNEVLKRTAVKNILSVAGNNSVTGATQTISAANLAPYRDGSGRVRVCFRVKTNRGFDDTGTGYTSGGAGAAWVDNVVLDHSGAGGAEVSSAFSAASEINNTPEVGGYAINSWKSTGKPPGILAHTHPLDGGDIGGGNFYAPLSYTDLCGPPSSPARFCNIYSVVMSVGDHDNNEAAGGASASFMPAERETQEGMASPTINLMSTGPGNFNSMGINSDIADVSDDYYIFYDMFAGVYNLFFTGNAWTFGYQSYPAVQANGSRAWGEFRVPGFQIFNPEPQCFIDWEPAYANGLISTSNANSIPDSLRIMLGKNQQCFRFAVTAGCSPTEGTYFDNVSLGFIDLPPSQLQANAANAVGTIAIDIWQWINDAFPNNETNGLPGTAAFDTCASNLRTGINQAQATGTAGRFDIPGDSIRVTGTGAGMRVDLVFRILPGVGNYVTIGNPATALRRVPTSTTAATANDGSFFGAYLGSNDGGSGFGTPGGHAGGVWNKNVWNSARCDTVELNYFPVALRGNLPGIVNGGWTNTLHDSDPKFSTIGILKNRCFLVDTAGAINATNTTCSAVPAWVTTVPYSGYNGVQTTRENTKIIPDGLLTPGAHVQYFFRKSELVAPSVFVSTPDTNRIFPQGSEGNNDGHRFQQFGVLPDRWKDASFGGQGMACALVVDYNDRRGNERVWISTADSIGANAQSKWGAHNGWHVFPGYVASDLTQDYTNEDVGADPTIAVWSHGGQPGTTYDMYQVKASESLTTSAGALGSRLANRAGMAIAAGKESKQGPTPEMLRTYYRLLFILSGDLNSGILGPFVNRSQDDITLITDFLTNSSGSATPRALYVMGDGFAQSETQTAGVNPAHGTLLTTYLAVSLRDPSYQSVSTNLKDVADLISTNLITTDGDVYGVQNTCLFSNDLLTVNGAVPGATAASFYENFGPNGPYVASVYAPSSITRPWVSMLDGWENEHLRSRYDDTNRGRLAYFFNVFSNVFASICQIQGAPSVTLDVPNSNRLSNFMSLSNNPVRSGSAQVHLGLATRDFVSVKLYDVAGRQVATLAERHFEPGTHTLTWDGTDSSGRPVARGVYFAQVKFAQQKERFAREIVVLK